MAREQRLVFGEVADDYQRARPSYPDALFDTIVELTGLRAGDAVLDVGAGTGKVTESLVARGFVVTAVEPSAEMARVLQSRLPGVTVHLSGFEECAVAPHSFAVMTAGQSWHWVDPERGPRKAHDVLRPDGWIALFWNSPALDDCEWHDELQPIYERIAPDKTHDALMKRMSASSAVQLDRLVSSDLFTAPVVRHIPWVERYTTSAYVALLGTHSDHRLLPDDQRAALHRAIADAIDARGGEVEHPYQTDLVAAQVK
jgi:SAM-dependent methyltransferase